MDALIHPTAPSGLGMLEAVVGTGFATALRDGLNRSATTGLPKSARLNGGSPTAGTTTALRRPSALPVDAAAVLRRFEAALPAALEGHDADVPALRPALCLHARRVLAAAAQEDTTDWPAPALLRSHPEAVATAASLLMTCAVQELLQDPDADAATTARRVARLARVLGTPAGDDADRLWRERRRMAREVHDELGSPLTLALRHLEDGRLAAAGRSVREAIDRTRTLTGRLHATTALPPLPEAVRAFAAQAAPAGIEVTVHATGDERLVSDACRRELFLAVRECLLNSFTHAATDRVRVTFRTTRRWTHARVEDDGRGFTPTPSHAPGLRSMTERIEDIGGRLTLESAPDEGTRVSIHLPLTPNPRA
ncbi:hypothetical protein GCM10010218_65130 [Streptomyces mashuensis]|uniref:Histidine kinase/HSP90-like ATPase domain-containing protein n=1 Tax=Streptomyces mashuensis TaxID=33904 RepID=A0A919BB31_9ACTN|nr:ATP-binding protein [Streptomyces mashuensis]GHF75049.1 hypothetical protein GCM10010218_65130 [Streptomyces mashuensis]